MNEAVVFHQGEEEDTAMIMRILHAAMLDSNCYILGDRGEAAVIDPGADHNDIEKVLDEHGLTLKYIILTHAHIDHVLEADELRRSRGGKFVMHRNDEVLLKDPLLNCSMLFGMDKVFGDADIYVLDGDTFELGNSRLHIIHTPGHTPGGICILLKDDQCDCERPDRAKDQGSGNSTYYAGANTYVKNQDRNAESVIAGNCIFTGDTLFRLGAGRTDLGCGDSEQLIASLKRLMELDDDVMVYPGHGPATDIGYERRYNPWL